MLTKPPRVSSQIVVLLSATALLAGCGGSSSSANSSVSASSPAASSSTTSSSTATTVSGTTSTSGSTAASSPAIAGAVKACKATVESQQSISSTVKTQLDHICDEAGAGNQAAVKKATHDVCVEIVKESVPASARQAAEASCPKA